MSSIDKGRFKYLQVIRPIVSRPEFISQVAFLGSRIFGSSPSSSITETVADMIELPDGGIELGEPVSQVVTISQPVLEVYDPDELKLLLLRLSVPTSMSGRYNFNHQASRFTARQPVQYGFRTAKQTARIPKNTIRNQLDAIAHSAGQNPRSTRVVFDRLQPIDDFGFGRELTLAPKIGRVATAVLEKQARLCHGALGDMAPSTGYPEAPYSPLVPFMRLTAEIESHPRYERFIELLHEHVLPVTFTIGEMDAHSLEASSRGI